MSQSEDSPKGRMRGIIVSRHNRFYNKQTQETLVPDKAWKDAAVGEIIRYATADGLTFSTFEKLGDKPGDKDAMEWVDAGPEGDVCIEYDYESSRVIARKIRDMLYTPGTYQEKVDRLGTVEEWPHDWMSTREEFDWEDTDVREPTLEEFMALAHHGKFYVDLSPTELATHRWRTIDGYLQKLSAENRKWALESIDETFHHCMALAEDNPLDDDLAEACAPTDIYDGLASYNNVIQQLLHPEGCPALRPKPRRPPPPPAPKSAIAKKKTQRKAPSGKRGKKRQ